MQDLVQDFFCHYVWRPPILRSVLALEVLTRVRKPRHGER